MAETQPMNLQALCYTAAEDRQALAALVCGEGVVDVGSGALLVTTTGAADHSVSVAEGQAYVEGDDDQPTQGMYKIANIGAEDVQLPVGSGGGLNRIDTIVARVRDSEYAGLDNDWVLEVVAGTAGAAAGASGAAFTSTVLATAGAVPDNAIVLGYVRVLAADTLTSTILAADVHDAREPFAACSGQFQDFTGVWVGPTLDAGGLSTHRYARNGDTITMLVEARFDAGGSGTWTLEPPVPPSLPIVRQSVGFATYYTAVDGDRAQYDVNLETDGLLHFYVWGTGTEISGSAAADDQFLMVLTYEALD